MRRLVHATLGGLALFCTTAAPASQKPCRDPQGRVVACPKPAKPAAARCKDEKGRFACKPPATGNQPH